MNGLHPVLQWAIAAKVSDGIRDGRLVGFYAWDPGIRNAILDRLWDAGYGTYAAGADRLVVALEGLPS